jgi:desulfoferrodoxin-like iron-binding protein
MNIYICAVCGHLEFNELGDNCPVCYAPKEKFSQNDNVFTEAAEKGEEASVKHIPSVKVNKECGLIPEDSCTDILIRIGETLHPMTTEHSIQFIDIYQNDKYIERIMLTPNINPAGCVHLKDGSGKITVVELCNLHGYWKTDVAL